jgi:HlyD family type I secretion membrane fusion protein
MEEVSKPGANNNNNNAPTDSKSLQIDNPAKKIALPTSVGPSTPAASLLVRDWKRPAAIGYGLIVFTFVVLGGWSAIAKLDSAVTAPGLLAVENSRKSVQHLEGGIIKEILVREGQHVEADQVLFRLDPTPAQANRDLQVHQLYALTAQEARLLAERNGASEIAWPDELAGNRSLPTVSEAIADQTKQFNDRHTSLHGQIDLLGAKIDQYQTEIHGLQVERQSTQEQLGYIVQELTDMHYLLGENLVPKTRVLALEREKSRLQGVIGRSQADEAKAQTGIQEAQVEIHQVQNKFNEEVASAILDVRQKLNDAREKIRVAQDVFKRVDITAPASGTVQNLKVFTVGGVIKPGETLLEVVPDSESLIVQAHVSPQDMDRMWAGMQAEVRFSAFKSSILPIIMGRVESVSRDRIVDETTHQPYFLAQVVVNSVPEELRDHLVAGMPAELIFPTGERTVLNYLVRPLQDRMSGAMRER